MEALDRLLPAGVRNFVCSPIGVVLLGVCAVCTWLGWYPVTRWKYRRVPGPFGLPFLGNLVDFAAGDGTDYLLRCVAKYGSVFKVWFGARPWVIISDPVLMRKLTYRYTARPAAMPEYGHVLTGHNHEVDQAGAFVASGEVWRRGRRVFEASIIHPANLAGHLPAINRCADGLAARLSRRAAAARAAAAAGGDGAVDMLAEAGAYTMAAVGEVAYGIDFGTVDDDLPQAQGGAQGGGLGARLVAASNACFRYLQIENATVYMPLNLMFPALAPLIRWMAHQLPDAKQKANMAARSAVADASRQLMERWREGKAAAEAAAAAAGGEAGADGAGGVTAQVQVGSGKAAAGGKAQAAAFREVGGGIAGSSFMAAMMEGRRGAKAEERLSDIEVIAQGFTFLLAGFETSAIALSMTSGLLAANPAAQARLAAEVDSVVGDRPLTPELLGQLPYTEAVLQEALRMYPSLPFLMREAREEVDLGGGKVVPKGATLVFHIQSLQTSEQLFPHADRFLPERFLPEGGGALGPADPSAWAPFGMGARMCVGHKLATMIAKAALVRMARRFSFRLAPGQAMPPPMRTGLSRSPVGGMRVVLEERAAA